MVAAIAGEHTPACNGRLVVFCRCSRKFSVTEFRQQPAAISIGRVPMRNGKYLVGPIPEFRDNELPAYRELRRCTCGKMLMLDLDRDGEVYEGPVTHDRY